jgi:hypothetical protein
MQKTGVRSQNFWYDDVTLDHYIHRLDWMRVILTPDS